MGEMVQIRSVKQYFNDYIVAGLKDVEKPTELDLIRVKNQMLDAFRREIFGQIAFKLGPEAATMSRDDLAKIDTVNNILKQSFRKWRRICILCGEAGLGSFFQLDDLKDVLNDESDNAPDAVILPEDEGEDVTDQTDGTEVYLNKSEENSIEKETEKDGI